MTEEEKKQYNKQWREKKKEYLKEYRKQWDLKNKERKKEVQKQYKLKNREHINKMERNKCKNNPNHNIKCNLRSRINNAINSQRAMKSLKTLDLTGCTLQFFMSYIEKQFKPGMSWEDRSSFHIDHIIPCSKFDLTLEEEQKKCFHYTNLQPLYPIENLKKHDKILTNEELFILTKL